MTTKIGVYCRVSSEEQRLNGVSLSDQRDRGIEFCITNGFQYEIFSDAGLSGTLGINERSGLSALMEGIILKNITGVWCTEFDRLSRDPDLSFIIRSSLIEENVKLYDLSGEVNLTDDTQRLLFAIKAHLAEFEIRKLKTRIKRALERNVINGKVGGGALIPYGYGKDENKNLIVNEIESEVVKTIFKLSIKGLGTKKIADYLQSNEIPTKRKISNVNMIVRGKTQTEFPWRDAVVYGILTNPIYKGKRRYQGKLYDCPAIVNEDDWELTQSLLKTKKNTKNTTNKYNYLLKGILFCPKCGARMYGRKREDNSDNYYMCSSQRYKGEWCGNRGINIDKSELLVWDSLINLPKDLKGKYDNTDIIDNNLILDKNRFESELEKIESKRQKLIDLLLDDSLSKDMVKPELIKLTDSKSFYEEKLNNVNFQISNKNIMNDTIEVIQNQLENLTNKDLTFEEKKNIIHSYIKKITSDWDEDLKRHRLVISYGLNNNTFSYIENTIDINFAKRGWRYDQKSVEVQVNAVTRNIDYDDKKFIGNTFEEIKN